MEAASWWKPNGRECRHCRIHCAPFPPPLTGCLPLHWWRAGGPPPPKLVQPLSQMLHCLHHLVERLTHGFPLFFFCEGSSPSSPLWGLVGVGVGFLVVGVVGLLAGVVWRLRRGAVFLAAVGAFTGCPPARPVVGCAVCVGSGASGLVITFHPFVFGFFGLLVRVLVGSARPSGLPSH